MTRRVVRAAPAKLNLFLEVVSRRADGYHELDSVFAAIDLHDTVELTTGASISLEVSGGAAPADESNLASRAARAFLGDSGEGVHIRLTKRIPMGAGLGGGSSDAAAVLLGLSELFDRPLEQGALVEIARTLGADVPFFLTAGLAHCSGVGEIVHSIQSGPKSTFLLISPDFGCSTPDVFDALATNRKLAGLTEKPQPASVFLEKYLQTGPDTVGLNEGSPYFNRLQEAAERMEPRLRAIREEAERRLELRFTMTGSGSSYFAEVESAMGNPPAPWSVEGMAVTPRIVRTV